MNSTAAVARRAIATPALALVALSALVVAAPSRAAAEAVVGSPAPAFSLTDIDGKPHALADYAGKVVVLEWVNYECPFVRKHYDSGNMQQLQKSAASEGVVWLSINSSAPGKQGNYPPETWKKLVADKGAAPAAVLLDPDGKVGKAYGAKTTPHMFVVDGRGTVVYAGAIDDTPSTNVADVKTAKNLVTAAVAETRSGKPVTVASAPPYGCSVKY
ncbi:MAG TPA: thioredoxin family protein [Burkholderiales bacterium]|nr:thioredoxin family protein [Burkholderiales bacterium]